MFKFNEFVIANEIWPNATPHIWNGVKSCLCGGWCIELTTSKGETFWHSCEFTHESPEEFFNDDFHTWMYKEDGWTPTGRLSFRGYYLEEYDFGERDYYYVTCDENGKEIER